MTKTEIGLIAFELFQEFGDKLKTSATQNLLPILDDIVFLEPKSLGYNSSGALLGKMQSFSDVILKISNFGIFIMLLWFGFRCIFAHFFDIKIENPLKGIMRMVIVAIFINASYFIAFTGVYFSSGFTDLIREKIGTNIVSFDYLNNYIEDNVEKIEYEEEEEVSSENSINTIIYCLVISLSVLCGMRYVLLHILILLSPIAFCFLLTKDTTKVFMYWLKTYAYSLGTQIVATLIVSIPYIVKISGESTIKIVICGVLVTLHFVILGMLRAAR